MMPVLEHDDDQEYAPLTTREKALVDALAENQAEIKRLREALERSADDDCGTWDKAMRYARDVLNRHRRAS